jgi:hypothetical protein
MRVRVAWALAAIGVGCATALGFGCAGAPVVLEELPEQPIALVYRTLAQGRDRAEELRRLRGESPDPVAAAEGVMRIGAVEDYVDRLRGGRRVTANLQGRLALLFPRTREVELLSAFVPGALPADWSADHGRLLAVSPQAGSAQLYEYSLERGELARLTGGHQPRLRGSYGPDGRLAWVEAQTGGGGLSLTIWVTDAGGVRPRRVSDGPHDQSPRWSPDGRVLLFESLLAGKPSIMAIDPDAPDASPQPIARGVEADISPRGDWVVYARDLAEGFRLWRMRLDGTGKSALGARSQGQADERHPSISPDGRYVVYVAEEEDRQHIRIRRMDGGGDRLLLEDGDGTLPVW